MSLLSSDVGEPISLEYFRHIKNEIILNIFRFVHCYKKYFIKAEAKFNLFFFPSNLMEVATVTIHQPLCVGR